MNGQRSIFAVAVTALVAVLMVTSASASPLLSGYGGPGQGNQAILGAALLNVPRGGSGSGGGSGTAGGEALPARTSGSPAASGGSKGGRRQGGSRDHGASVSGARPYTARRFPTRTSAVSSQTLGLSGSDLLYIVLVLGALVAMGALTAWLARQSRREQGVG